MKKVRVGVAGYGTIGQRLADGVAMQEDMELVGVADLAPTLPIRALFEKGMPYDLYLVDGADSAALDAQGIPISGTFQDLLGKVDIMLLKEILNSFTYSTSKTNNQDEFAVQDDNVLTPNNTEEQYDLSDLLYRQNPYKLGKTYAKGTLSIYKNDLLLKTDSPQKIIVVFNDEFLQEIEISGELTEYKVEKSGCYGFYIQDAAGNIYDINDNVHITCNTIEWK